MFRKITAVTLLISFVAMASSGLAMFFIEKPSFTIQMHPVHKLFGLLMVIAVVSHLSLNYKGVLHYLKTKQVAFFGSVLAVILVLLYGVAMDNQVPEHIAQPMDELAAQADIWTESRE